MARILPRNLQRESRYTCSSVHTHTQMVLFCKNYDMLIIPMRIYVYVQACMWRAQIQMFKIIALAWNSGGDACAHVYEQNCVPCSWECTWDKPECTCIWNYMDWVVRVPGETLQNSEHIK